MSTIFWEKAEENLAAAQAEFLNDRYNSSANRSYYSCFQAAVYALARAGIEPHGPRGAWGHDAIQAEFHEQLLNRRKVYPAALRGTLNQNYTIRQVADYTADHVTERRPHGQWAEPSAFCKPSDREGVRQHEYRI